MSIRLELVEVGSRVAYQDALNPRREGRVAAILLDGREFAVAWDERAGYDDQVVTTSDLRQAGWSLLAELPGNPFDGADIIHVVTRTDLIESGDLVPATELVPDEPDFARQAGFVATVALTRAVAALVVPTEREAEKGVQDVKGRLWDLLNMARMYRRRGAGEWLFPCLFYCAGRPGIRGGRNKVVFKCVITEDDGEPAVTILMREED